MEVGKDQKLVERFLSDFVDELVKKHGEAIDFILLFGSAARGEWKRGVSDIDLIIGVKSREYVEPVRSYAEKLFWELDEKHGTLFHKVCSTAGRSKLDRALRKARLYVPFEVFAPEDMDWERGEIKRNDLKLGAKLVASQAMLFLKMKREGKILYGRDIRKVIRVKPTLWEKFKAIMVPFYMSLLSSIGAPFFPKLCLKLSSKAVLYSIESALLFMDRPVRVGVERNKKALERLMNRKVEMKAKFLNSAELDVVFTFSYRKLIDLDFVDKALEIKYSFDKAYEKMSRKDILAFCLKALRFVVMLNFFALYHNAKTKRYMQALTLFIILLITYLLLVLVAIRLA